MAMSLVISYQLSVAQDKERGG